MNQRIQQYLIFFQYLYQEYPEKANELLPLLDIPNHQDTYGLKYLLMAT
jgi:hypothetical protein